MTPQEFKAWFDGFTEAFTGLPNKTQWTRIKARVAEIDGSPVTERVYIDRYWPTYVSRPYWWTTTGGLTASGTTGAVCVGTNTVISNCSASGGGFDSLSAMADLGRLEAHTIAA